MKKLLLLLIMLAIMIGSTSMALYAAAPMIGGGSNAGYALKSDGTVWSWGENSSGQLGDNSTSQRKTPVQVSNLTGVTAIEGGYNTGYALGTGGAVWSWGQNSYGKLGDGTTSQRRTPVQVKGELGVGNLTGVTAIAGGIYNGYALKGGIVWSWGTNSTGALGINKNYSQMSESKVPVQVVNLTGVTAIAAGDSAGYALKSDGTVWAWGDNVYGKLGNGTTNSSLVPVQVSNLSGVTAIASHNFQAYALKSNGTVWAWGSNSTGQLGNGTTTNSSVPVQVSNLTGVTAIVSAGTSAYALKQDGTVWAWGYNYYGSTGNNSNTNYFYVPVQVKDEYGINNLTGVTAIAGGYQTGYALKSNGTVLAWGRNDNGELGNNSTTDSKIPVPVWNLTLSASDTTAPTISFSPTSGNSIYTTGSVTITASDASSVSTLYYKWDSNSYASVVGGTRTVTPPSTGSHTLYAYATDSPGNTSGVYSATYTVTVQDTTAPTATMTYSKNPAKSGDIVTITATFSEPMATTPIVKIALSGLNTVAAINMTVQNATHYTYAYTVPAGNGTETVALSVGTDVAGNVVVATPTNNTLTIDNTSPANPNISINPTTATNANVTVTITYAADAITKSYNINGGTSNSYTGPFTVSSNCTVNASAADAAGNWSSQVAYVISNIDTTPPTLTITSNPSTSSTNASSITYTFAFSKSVTGFVKGDVVVN
ncbi:MAG TPA: hypothetical protein DIC60_04800, partial [Lachnospiraceae bacterium]|nr:hypothetical protein [Lachnospiraceae bacterium]